MSAEPVDDVAVYLAGAGLGLTVGSNLFKWNLVDTPDAQVALIPYGGPEPDAAFGKVGLRWTYQRLQVVSRGARHADRVAQVLLRSIHAALALEATTLSGTFYHRVWPLNQPLSLGSDANQRPMYAFNVQLDRDEGP